tara:strand:+ start:376 stop:573 length:198 start_codon:yes stop_codon:yes gene_type:complete
MKASKANTAGDFTPIGVRVTIETQDELDAILNIFSLDVRSGVLTHKERDRCVIMNLLNAVQDAVR